MLNRYIPTNPFPPHHHTHHLAKLTPHPAVIIGCCPAFAILINAFRTKTTYDSRGYRKQTDSNSKARSDVQLRTIGAISTRERNQKLGLQTDAHWADAHSSQEELRADHDGIMVSTTVTQKGATAGGRGR